MTETRISCFLRVEIGNTPMYTCTAHPNEYAPRLRSLIWLSGARELLLTELATSEAKVNLSHQLESVPIFSAPSLVTSILPFGSIELPLHAVVVSIIRLYRSSRKTTPGNLFNPSNHRRRFCMPRGLRRHKNRFHEIGLSVTTTRPVYSFGSCSKLR